jgi:hypothetical protein
MAPLASGRAEELAVDNVQPETIVVRRGQSAGSHIRVAPGTGGMSAGAGRS